MGKENLILDKPGRFNSSFLDRWNPTKADVIHLASTLKYSDLIINVSSTLVIEAAIFDTPIINIGFDGYQNKSYLESVRRYYDYYTHYLNIIKSGGVKIAKSPGELISLINQYLENPSLDKEGRKRIVQEQLWKFDGKSAERVAEYVAKFLT